MERYKFFANPSYGRWKIIVPKLKKMIAGFQTRKKVEERLKELRSQDPGNYNTARVEETPSINHK